MEDLQREKAVWERVMSAKTPQERALPERPAPEQTPLAHEQVLSLWQEARRRLASMTALWRSGGGDSALLRQMLARQRQQVQGLRGLYFYLTGSCPHGELPEQPKMTSGERLRDLLQGSERLRAQYQRLRDTTEGLARQMQDTLRVGEEQQLNCLLTLLRRMQL